MTCTKRFTKNEKWRDIPGIYTKRKKQRNILGTNIRRIKRSDIQKKTYRVKYTEGHKQKDTQKYIKKIYKENHTKIKDL